MTDAQPGPGGDELRTRYYLRRLGAHPLGHQEPTVSIPEPRRPVSPTRVIPAGAPLPARAPEPGEVPPWRTPPPPPPPPVVTPPP
ncbi:type VII secretion-associated serine protease, partial [Streptomyces sp. NPDC058299]